MLLVQNLGYNAVSVGLLAVKGTHSLFCGTLVRLQHKHGFKVGNGTRKPCSRLYTLPNEVEKMAASTLLATTDDRTSSLWHRRQAQMD